MLLEGYALTLTSFSYSGSFFIALGLFHYSGIFAPFLRSYSASLGMFCNSRFIVVVGTFYLVESES